MIAMKIKLHFILFTALFMLFAPAWAQVDTSHSNYKKFYYDNGQLASEGLIVEGKPNGYWKTYYRDGTLKSEGNRENFKLDSTWKFNRPDGELAMIINYEQGLKDGLRITYSDDEIITEQFKEDIKQGWKKVFFQDSTLKREVLFENGKKEGYEKVYDREGNIISLMEYDNGFLVSREFINRRDKQGRKQGPWKTFYSDGTIKSAGSYLDGQKHGIFKNYDREGNLENIEKYEKGKKAVRDKSVADYEIRKNYYPDGSIKTQATYLDGKMDGIRREYDKQGNITGAYVMDQGKVVGEGIVDKTGMKQDEWKEYYESGRLKAEGYYKDNRKVGKWIYYFENGEIEQRGEYNDDGKAIGEWRWYYSNGQLRRKEFLNNDIPDGMYKEYTNEGEIWAEGRYIEGLRNGPWIINHLGYKQVGQYNNDVRQGMWRYYKDDVLVYEGRFEDGLPDGKHVAYWDNGNLRYEGVYNMGEKNGEWNKYTSDGQLFLVITYQFGEEIKYDNKKIELPEKEVKE
ncbi:MAG: toxin-antitoxin system YwqK family antitoxin [Bacteroidota bacterium]